MYIFILRPVNPRVFTNAQKLDKNKSLLPFTCVPNIDALCLCARGWTVKKSIYSAHSCIRMHFPIAPNRLTRQVVIYTVWFITEDQIRG